MAGRQILDVVLVANEVVEDYRKRNKKGLCSKLILKRHTITLGGVFWTLCYKRKFLEVNGGDGSGIACLLSRIQS